MTMPSAGASEAWPALSPENQREAYTMALYVAVCLLAALSALAERADTEDVSVLKVVWGTTVGLAIAHWFAFRVSARLVAAGAVRRADAESAAAQILGALAVAVLASIPVLLLPVDSELDVVRLMLAGVIAAVGFAVARGGGADSARSGIYALTILIVATAIAIVKNVLAGH